MTEKKTTKERVGEGQSRERKESRDGARGKGEPRTQGDSRRQSESGRQNDSKRQVGNKGQGQKKSRSRKAEIVRLVLLLLLVIGGTTLFVGAVAGWFDGGKRAVIEASDRCETCGQELADVTGEEYEQMVKEGKSFVIFIDQEGCTTADKVEGYVKNYAGEKKVRIYRMQFSEARETSMHEKVKYYPSVVVVSKGGIIGYLRADSDEDAHAYNDEATFREWVGRYVED